MHFLKEINLKTEGFTDIIDVTPHISSFISENEIKQGWVTVFTRGSTGAVTTIEYEPNLVKDFKNAMERIAPSDMEYEHKKTWNDDNGCSHIRASVVGCSETIPVSGGKALLGTWQQVVVVDFDTGARNRTVYLSGGKT